jgi:hypothetical protein
VSTIQEFKVKIKHGRDDLCDDIMDWVQESLAGKIERVEGLRNDTWTGEYTYGIFTEGTIIITTATPLTADEVRDLLSKENPKGFKAVNVIEANNPPLK